MFDGPAPSNVSKARHSQMDFGLRHLRRSASWTASETAGAVFPASCSGAGSLLTTGQRQSGETGNMTNLALMLSVRHLLCAILLKAI